MSVLSRKIDRVMCNILHPPIPPGPNAMYSPSTHNQPPVQRYPNAMYSMHAPMCNQIWNIPPSVPTPSATHP